MRKFLIFILSIILLVSTSLLLVGCKEKQTYNPNDGRITITYYDGISSESKTCLIPKETLVKDFYVLKKDGCKFLGFYDNAEGGLQIFDETGEQKFPLISNATLYAQWEKIAYNKTFYVNSTYGNSVSETRTVYSGDTIENLPIPTVKPGYEFYGWRIGEEGRVISDGGAVKEEYQVVGSSTKDIWLNTTKFYAEIGKKRYNVTLHYNDGETPDEVIKVTHGGSLEDLPELFSDDTNKLDFRGWSKFEDEYVDYRTVEDYNYVDSDVDVYAYWRYYKEINLVVTADNVVKAKVYDDEFFTFPTSYTRPGYISDEWYEDNSFMTIPLTELDYRDVNLAATYYLKWSVDPSDYVSGNGTELNPYEINSAYQLQHISYHLDCHYKLISNINITGINWEPIGGHKGENAFVGSLDGNGKTISGLGRSDTLSVNDEDKSYFGLFGKLGEGAVVKNLTITGVIVDVLNDPAVSSGTTVISYFGGVAGLAEKAKIENVTVSGSLTFGKKNTGRTLMAGIVAKSVDSEIKSCTNNANVTVTKFNAISAGIVAYANGGKLVNCTNNGAIKSVLYSSSTTTGYAYAAVICAATNSNNEVSLTAVYNESGSANAIRYTSTHKGSIAYASNPESFAFRTSSIL